MHASMGGWQGPMNSNLASLFSLSCSVHAIMYMHQMCLMSEALAHLSTASLAVRTCVWGLH